MKIHVHDIEAEGLTVEVPDEVLQAVLSLQRLRVAPEPLRVSLSLSRLEDEMVVVEGELEGAVMLSCSRCLTEFSSSMHEAFRYLYRPPVQPGGEEYELSADELDEGVLEDGFVDVDRIVEEQLVLATPTHPLCQEACRGLCQQCGVDLNKDVCSCVRPTTDSRWETLRDLTVQSRQDNSKSRSKRQRS